MSEYDLEAMEREINRAAASELDEAWSEAWMPYVWPITSDSAERQVAKVVAAARADERRVVLAKVNAIVAAPAPVAWNLLDELRAYLEPKP